MLYKNLHKPMKQSKIIYQFVTEAFPIVKEELSHWRKYSDKIPDKILSQQAANSIKKKTFHAQGGSIYGLYNNKINPQLIKFIVSLQTISDYLDNLCDRVGIEDENAFLHLHQAITDALNPNDDFSHYYVHYPHHEDGNYLYSLVHTCKQYIKTLPSYDLVKDPVISLGKLYGEMQSYKHIHPSIREDFLINWAKPYLKQYGEISPWEFSAAAGSTLAIFLLCALAEDENLTKEEVIHVGNAYFPWVCGFHILLDYFIDEREDYHTGDLNFVSFYENDREKEERLLLFLNNSLSHVSKLKNPLFHITIIEGLLAMYLSDPKASNGDERKISKKMIKHSFYTTNALYGICKKLRSSNIIG